MNNAPRIAIIGGGPGGLVLARHLQRHGVAATVFELDAHPLARPQGGSLDLHAESGLRALRELDLEAPFLAVARYDDQGGAIYDVAGVCHHTDDGNDADGTPGERPEIDRTQLRALLLDSLNDGTVVWDSKVRRIVADGDRWRVFGFNGSDDVNLGAFDLVVGADGAWSKVRPLLSAAQPDYLGLLCYELMIDDVDTKHGDVAALLPHGKITVVAEGRGLIAQRSSNGHVRVYVMLRVADDVVDAHHLEQLPPAETRAQLVSILGLSSSTSCLITAANDTITRRPIVALPVGHRWDHRRGLTLVGDAAHVMSPFSGEGVNMAMLDGLELGLAITAALSSSSSSSSSTLDAAIADAEARMFVRAADAAAGANAAASTWPAQTLQFIAEGAQDLHGLYNDVVRTPQQVFDTQFAAQTKDPTTRAKLKGSFCFELTGPTGGSWVVDYGDASAGVRRGEGPARCTVTMSDADFLLMTSGGLSPRRAFMTKRLKIAGDMGLAFKLSDVIAG